MKLQLAYTALVRGCCGITLYSALTVSDVAGILDGTELKLCVVTDVNPWQIYI